MLDFAKELLKRLDLNNIKEERVNSTRTLKNKEFRVSKKYYDQVLIPQLKQREEHFKYLIKDTDTKHQEEKYNKSFNYLIEASKEKEALVKFLTSSIYIDILKQYDICSNSILFKIGLNSFIEEVKKQELKEFVEVSNSLKLSDYFIFHLNNHYNVLLGDIDTEKNKSFVKLIAEDMKKLDMVNKYNKQLINCKIITI